MKCGKVKNPCKICFQSVSKKNGLQCKGACKKWAHYKCLNFTPGKISDIKAGIIKISCPCPGCMTSEPKEVLTDPPFTCTNQKCPATQIPSCESTDCPSKQKPIPSFQPGLTPSRPGSPRIGSPAQEFFPPIIIPNPPPLCPTPPRRATPPRITSPTRRPRSPVRRQASPQRRPASPPRRPASPPRRPVSPPRRPVSPPRGPVSPPKRPASPPRGRLPSPPKPPCPSCPKHCPKRPKANAANNLCSPQRSNSCSLVTSRSTESGKSCFDATRTFSSDSQLSNGQEDQKNVFSTVEDMCNTVGQLSCQLKELMCRMKNAFEKQNRCGK